MIYDYTNLPTELRSSGNNERVREFWKERPRGEEEEGKNAEFERFG